MKKVIKIIMGVFQHLNGVEVTRVTMALRVLMVIVDSLVTVTLDLLVDFVKQNHSRQVFIIELPKVLRVVIKTAMSAIHNIVIIKHAIRPSNNDTCVKTGRVDIYFGLCHTKLL